MRKARNFPKREKFFTRKLRNFPESEIQRCENVKDQPMSMDYEIDSD